MTSTDAVLRIDDLADLCGGLEWIADALFVLEGRWSATMDSSSAVEHLAVQSRRHGWHVGLWHDLLPDSPALEGASRVRPPAGWQDALDVASAFGDDGGDAVRLALLARGFLPRLLAAVDGLHRRTLGPGDAAIHRVSGFVRTDVVDDFIGAGALLGAAIGGDDAIDGANDAVKALDQAFRNQ